MSNKHPNKAVIFVLALFMSFGGLVQPGFAQTAQKALDTYEEGPVWQIMTFRTPPGRTEDHLKNISLVWEKQLILAVEKEVLVDYKILTKWSAHPEDWNIMVIEMFPNMASYDTFWVDWAGVDAETVDTPELAEALAGLEPTGTQFLGTVFAREVTLKRQ